MPRKRQSRGQGILMHVPVPAAEAGRQALLDAAVSDFFRPIEPFAETLAILRDALDRLDNHQARNACDLLDRLEHLHTSAQQRPFEFSQLDDQALTSFDRYRALTLAIASNMQRSGALVGRPEAEALVESLGNMKTGHMLQEKLKRATEERGVSGEISR